MEVFPPGTFPDLLIEKAPRAPAWVTRKEQKIGNQRWAEKSREHGEMSVALHSPPRVV